MSNQTKRRAGQPSVITGAPCAPRALSAIYSKDLHTNGIEHPTVQSYRVQSNFTPLPSDMAAPHPAGDPACSFEAQA
jgi:hypothetical protein